MRAETKFFGTIDIEDDKIIHFPNGIIGFENLKNFALIFDSEREERSNISWLQSMDEPLMVLPVINPMDITESYTPLIEVELRRNSRCGHTDTCFHVHSVRSHKDDCKP